MDISGKDIAKLVLYFFLGAIFIGAITHATGAATLFGSLFKGVNAMGVTLEGR